MRVLLFRRQQWPEQHHLRLRRDRKPSDHYDRRANNPLCVRHEQLSPAARGRTDRRDHDATIRVWQRPDLDEHGGGDYYVAHDAQGSVVAVTAGNGTTEASYSYDAFGNQLAATTQSGAPSIPLRYEGEYLDPTGLYHLQARQYDPTSGTFTAQDPATADPKSPAISLYSYVGNQPTVLEDPTGEFSRRRRERRRERGVGRGRRGRVGRKPVLKAVGKDVAVECNSDTT